MRLYDPTKRLNENVKDNNSFSRQNENFVRAFHFLVHFFAVSARLRRETA